MLPYKKYEDMPEWRRRLRSVSMYELRWMGQGIVPNYQTLNRTSLTEALLAPHYRPYLHDAWQALQVWNEEEDDDAGVQIRAGDGTLVRTIHRQGFGLETPHSEPIHYAEQLTDTYESLNRLAVLQTEVESDAFLQNIQEWDKKLRPKPSDPGRVSGKSYFNRWRYKPKPQFPKEGSGLEYWQEMYRLQLDIFEKVG